MSLPNYEAITVSTVSIGITPALIDQKENYALITIEDQPLRFRLDGTAPTSTEGHLRTDTDAIELYGNDELRKFRMIRDGGVDATVRVSTGFRFRGEKTF